MDRSHPGAVTPENLIAFLDGEAPPEVAAHLRDCAICRGVAAEYARVQGPLLTHLWRFDCPAPQALGEYELGLLRPEERTSVAAHVVDCPHCGDELHQLRGFLATEPAAPTPGPFARARRVVATLLAPSPGGAFAGLRGGDDDATRTYRADDLTITIDTGFEPRRARGSLAGLIWRESGDPAVVEGSAAVLVAADGTAQAAEVDDLGNFGFDELAPGTYRLEVALEDRHVAIEELHIGLR